MKRSLITVHSFRTLSATLLLISATSVLGYWLAPLAGIMILGILSCAFLALLAREISIQIQQVEARISSRFRHNEEFVALACGTKIGPIPTLGGATLAPDAANILLRQIRMNQPKVVVELGSGISTLLVASALAEIPGSKLLSFDHDSKYFQQTKDTLESFGLSANVYLSYAPIREQNISGRSVCFYDIDIESLPRKIDFLIVDGPPSYIDPHIRWSALPFFAALLAESAVIFMDDCNRLPEQEILKEWEILFPGIEIQVFNTEKGNACILMGSHRTEPNLEVELRSEISISAS